MDHSTKVKSMHEMNEFIDDETNQSEQIQINDREMIHILKVQPPFKCIPRKTWNPINIK